MSALIALDLDGTLEDSRQDMVAAVRRARVALKLPPRADALLNPWVNQGMDTLYRNCFDDYLLTERPERLAAVRALYEADYAANVAVATRLYPGIADALGDLAVLGPLAVVTNKPEKISRLLLAALGADKFFTAVIGGDTCPDIKPNPVMLEAAAKKCGFTPAQGRAVMIGDTGADIKMGKAFGAATVWCGWGYVQTQVKGADFIAKTPADLPGIVQRAFKIERITS